MNVIERRDLQLQGGDIAVVNGDKFLVIFETSCIAWYFVDLKKMRFDEEICTDTAPRLGSTVEGLGTISHVIKGDNISLVIE